MALEYTFSKLLPKDFQSLEQKWKNLEDKTPTSFFQSWAFIETLYQENQDISFKLFEIKKDNKPICLALFGDNQGLYLNQTGIPARDKVYIEYNAPLFAKEYEKEAFPLFQNFISDFKSEPIYLAGLKQDFKHKLSHQAGLLTYAKSPCYSVDLNKDKDEDAYLKGLSKTTRRHLKRTKSYYGENDVKISPAQDVDTALHYLDQLAEIHNKYWGSKGVEGSFETKEFMAFHQSLIKNHFDLAKIHVIKIESSQHLLGYFYLFEHEGVIHYYQSGIDYPDDAKIKPGLYGHFLLINYFRNNGKSIYDFMAGDQQYKKSLGEKYEVLYWMDTRPKFMTLIMKILKKIKPCARLKS